MKYDNYIAIDPDTVKSGVAFLKRETKQLELSSLDFTHLVDYLQFVKKQSDETGDSVIIIVEASWQTKYNWHKKKKDSKAVSSAKGYDVGRNHRTGQLIVEMAESIGLKVIEQFPLKKDWKGPDKKITHNELKFFTGIVGRTNQEERDAALIAWVHAGLPIRVLK